MTGGAEVVVERVSKAFEDGRIRALAEASLRLDPGEFVSLTGPSGSGCHSVVLVLAAVPMLVILRVSTAEPVSISTVSPTFMSVVLRT